MPRPRTKAEQYGVLVAHALKEHAHCTRMWQGAATAQVAEYWYQAALREEAAAIGFTRLAVYHARQENLEVTS